MAGNATPERYDKKEPTPHPQAFLCAARNICMAGETRRAPGIVGDACIKHYLHTWNTEKALLIYLRLLHVCMAHRKRCLKRIKVYGEQRKVSILQHLAPSSA